MAELRESDWERFERADHDIGDTRKWEFFGDFILQGRIGNDDTTSCCDIWVALGATREGLADPEAIRCIEAEARYAAEAQMRRIGRIGRYRAYVRAGTRMPR